MWGSAKPWSLGEPRAGDGKRATDAGANGQVGSGQPAELARRLGTTQSAIARLEGGRVSPSFATLRRYAEATGTRLTVGLVQADS